MKGSRLNASFGGDI